MKRTERTIYLDEQNRHREWPEVVEMPVRDRTPAMWAQAEIALLLTVANGIMFGWQGAVVSATTAASGIIVQGLLWGWR